jgi:hypothetical protein
MKMNISCQHEPLVKCIRFSIGDSKDDPSGSIAVIKLCQDCWSNFVSLVSAASTGEAKDAKYIDDSKVPPRTYTVVESQEE